MEFKQNYGYFLRKFENLAIEHQNYLEDFINTYRISEENNKILLSYYSNYETIINIPDDYSQLKANLKKDLKILIEEKTKITKGNIQYILDRYHKYLKKISA